MTNSEKILGLDLGTNSIGWAIRDINAEDNQIIDNGVLTFSSGVAYVEGREQPKVKVRTDARGKRRNYQAEKYRKWELLECLIEKQMCPLTIEELNVWRYYKKGLGRKYPESQKFHNWLRFDFDGNGKPDFEKFGANKHDNCYVFRAFAASDEQEHKKLFADHPMLLGRVFYQMVQRRGFMAMDIEDPETKLIEEGRKNPETKEIEVVGIKVINTLIKEKYKTLGAALYWGQKNNELEVINNNRIRNRFTYRHYFESELDFIYKNLGYDIESDFCKRVKTAIIWQRPLRSQKGLVGFCTLDAPLKSRNGLYYKPGKKRIPLSHPLYEEYRTWCDINNLKIDLPDGVDRVEFLATKVFPLFSRASNFYFSDKKSEEKKDKKQTITRGLNYRIEELGAKVLANYDNDLGEEDEGKRYNANTFQNWLEDVFGEQWQSLLKWDETLTGKEKDGTYLRAEDIWHLCYDAMETKKQREDLSEKLIPIFSKHFPEIPFEAKQFEKIRLAKGYASLSASTIRKILPFLKRGMIYSQAVFISNLDKVLGRKLTESEVERIAVDFSGLLKEHNKNKEIYSVVNDLVSDRLNEQDRLNCGEDYELDELDLMDIREKIKNRFKAKTWKKKSDDQQKLFVDSVAMHYQEFLRKPVQVDKAGLYHKIYRLDDVLSNYLIEKHNADPNRVKNYLWHPSEQEKYPPAATRKGVDGKVILDESGKPILFLGDPNPISRGFKNPMAMRAIQELKKHLNYLLKVGKIDYRTKVVVEIARELNDANRRRAIERWQGVKRRSRDAFKMKIEECFLENNIPSRSITENMLDRYELWEEQKQKCLYCGQPITCVEVLNGTAQLEHTIPAKLSNCDELYNLTMAHAHCNTEKAKRFPTQWTERYPEIKENIKFIYAAFKSHEELFENTFDAARRAKDKSSKDTIIQNRHFQKMHLDYWRKKYETFTIDEVTNQFRRQQLTDTQIITKYSLPYLRTVFNRVEVQKGIVTDKFRKIFQIEPRKKGKDRKEHSHHAIDAAVLTLIPPSSIRDFLMREYNEAVDNNTLNTYQHPKPKNYSDFHQSHILSIKDEIVINHVSHDRTLKRSVKKKRMRGEIVKDANGKPIMLKGDAVRGKLHDESIFGMVKMPETNFDQGKHRLKIVEGKLVFKQNESRKDELFVVKKIKIEDIKTLEQFEEIVIDPNLGSYLKTEVKRRMSEFGIPIEQAVKNIYAFGKSFDKNSNPLRPIRHLRCLVNGVQSPASVKSVEPAFESKRLHKRSIYATNAKLPVCALYEWIENAKVKREVIPIPILDMAKTSKQNQGHVVEEKIPFHKGTGKNKKEFVKQLTCLLKPNQAVVFYQSNFDELKELYSTDRIAFSKRVYKVLKFEDGKVFFDFHLTALQDKDIMKQMEERGLPKKGDSKVNFENPTLRLRLSQGSLNMAIEGLHFQIERDGQIKWLF
jgi:CRISPR-associated endonuclease Csn1